MASPATNRPSPMNTSTPRSRKRRALSWREIRALRARIDSIAAAKLPSPLTGGPAKRSAAVRASCQARAARMSPFDGTQP